VANCNVTCRGSCSVTCAQTGNCNVNCAVGSAADEGQGRWTCEGGV
jgi:hypothetical protein